MPQLNGNDRFPNPLQYDCTGYAGMSFPYNTSLTGNDTYLIHMWGDFALTQLTLVDASVVPQPTLSISMTSSNFVRLNWPTNNVGFTLLQNSNLLSTSWVVVTNAASVIGTNNQVTLPNSNGDRFFILSYF